MVQVAAALLFAVAAGLGLTVILAMLKNNDAAILSALLGEGAFPVEAAPQPIAWHYSHYPHYYHHHRHHYRPPHRVCRVHWRHHHRRVVCYWVVRR